MSKINREVNVKTLVALRRVYSAQLELYKYILSHEVPFGDTEDTFMRRTLSDLADASEKILAHINLNTYHEAMYMHVRVAFGSVRFETRFRSLTDYFSLLMKTIVVYRQVYQTSL